MNNSGSLRPLVILGPTTVGKTDVAFRLARLIGAEIINADKFYLYDKLPTLTGQSDASLYPDVCSHLYGTLHLNADQWLPDRYATAVKAHCLDIRARNRPIIVEGCSNTLIRTAVGAIESCTESSVQQPLLFGLRWKSESKISYDCDFRAAQMLSRGMAAEFQQAMKDGAGETYLVRKCFARNPLSKLLCGRIGVSRCRNQIGEELERHARRHYANLSRIPNVTWIDHDRGRPDVTIAKILELAGAVSQAPLN